MKNYNTYILIIIISLFSVKCNDDFVDIPPEYSIDSENYFNIPEDYAQAVIAAYDLLQTTYLNSMLGEIASDNTLCGGESATDVPGFQQIDDMIHTPVNDNLQDLWNWMFAGVQRAAYVIEFKDKIDFDGKDALIAEAYFLRAYYNFELVKWFGPIPIKAEGRFSVGDEQRLPRSPISDVYELIEDDLLAAIPNLPLTPGQEGRVTSGAAKSLLGKAYVYQDKFDEASSILEEVINSGAYSLVENYDEIFEHQGENGAEAVFEVQYSDAEGASFDCFQCSEGNIAVGFNGIRQYNGPVFDSGFSFNVPTQEAVDAFETGDLRKDVAILDIERWANQRGATYGRGYEHTGYFNRKYIARKGDSNVGDQNLTNPNNYRAIRYADVLLLAAEANARKATPDENKARTYLNLVRQRAFGTTSRAVSASGAVLIDAIFHERRVEFVGEGHRFFDLVRTGRAAQEIDGFTSNKNELFPVPFEEIQFSNGNWEQNNGY
ncbi:MAG: RagB/SusD family nutrient uptake outer membrane protein [Flavobacteriaceae bacterium]